MSRNGNKLMKQDYGKAEGIDHNIIDFRKMDAEFCQAMLFAINNHSEGDGGIDDMPLLTSDDRIKA